MPWDDMTTHEYARNERTNFAEIVALCEALRGSAEIPIAKVSATGVQVKARQNRSQK